MKLIKGIAATIVILLLTACGSAQPKVQEVTLEAKDISYSLNTIEVVAGQPVRLTVTDSGALDHDFSIIEIPVVITTAAEEVHGHTMGAMPGMTAEAEPQLHIAVAPGTSNVIEFTPTKPGTYEFFCTVAGHKEAGMLGKLIVKEP